MFLFLKDTEPFFLEQAITKKFNFESFSTIDLPKPELVPVTITTLGFSIYHAVHPPSTIKFEPVM